MVIRSSLTILFEDPFWIGLYERIIEDKYEVSKIIFGAEPKDYEVYDFLLKNWNKLRFSPVVEIDNIEERKINPKRRQREVKKQMENRGIATKAQQALKLQYEQNKLGKRTRNRELKEAEKERKFALRQEKKKVRHRGR